MLKYAIGLHVHVYVAFGFFKWLKVTTQLFIHSQWQDDWS